MSAKTSDLEIDRFSRHWFVLPSMFWLVLVTISGAWIRHIWAFPGESIVDAKHLTHAHSHIALLGWCWGIVVAYLLRKVLAPKRGLWFWRLFAVVFHVSVGGMFITFAQAGYWKWSIIFSAVHVTLGTLFVVLYFVKRRKLESRTSLLAFDAALLLALIANVAPMMLSFGSMQTTSAVTIAVNSYVHLQCFGFLVLFLMGMLYDAVITDNHLHSNRLVYLITFASIPSQLVAVAHLIDGELDLIIGSLGMAAYAVGLFLVLYQVYQNWDRVKLAGCQSMLRAVMTGGFVLASALLIASVPMVSDVFREARFLVIGIIHLLLLGMVTPVFLYYSHRRSGMNEHDVKPGVIVLMLSIWVMLLILIFAGLGQGLGVLLPFHVPKALFYSAIPISLAAIYLFMTALRRSFRME